MRFHRTWRAALALVFLGALATRAVADDDKPADKDKEGEPPPVPEKAEPPKAVKPEKNVTVPSKPGAKPIIIERVVAVVNDTVILESELYQRAAPELADLNDITDPREKQRQFKLKLRRVLDDMVDEELIIQAAAEAQLEVSDDEVDKAIAEVKKSNHLTDQQLADALQMQGYTMEAYRKDVRRQILRLRAINVLVRPRVSVTDDEVKERYKQMTKKAGAVSELRLAHILVAVPEGASAEDKAAARRRASEILERARGGEDFGKLALETSEDLDTKKDGGVLGWFKRGELPTEWEEQLFRADKGELRGPIEGPRGYEVFLIVDEKKEQVKTFEASKDDLRNDLYAEQMEKQTKIWLQELHRKSHVEVKL
jgi:parvulin-like peptidyl-prolyl isomerase